MTIWGDNGSGGTIPGPPPTPTQPATRVRYVDPTAAQLLQDGSQVYPYATIQQAVADIESGSLGTTAPAGRIYLSGTVVINPVDPIVLTTGNIEIVGLFFGRIIGQMGSTSIELNPNTTLTVQNIDLVMCDIAGIGIRNNTEIEGEFSAFIECTISNVARMNAHNCSLTYGAVTADSAFFSYSAIYAMNLTLDGLTFSSGNVINSTLTLGPVYSFLNLLYVADTNITLQAGGTVFVSSVELVSTPIAPLQINNQGATLKATSLSIVGAVDYTHVAPASLIVDGTSNHYLNATTTVTANGSTFAYGTSLFGAVLTHDETGI